MSPGSRVPPGEPELLDIRQAAALLHVSQASLRRWSDAGRLPSYRLGGRRERRFRRSDLFALLEPSPAAPARPGHLCALYGSVLARARQAAEFLAERGRDGSVAFLVMEPDARAHVLVALEQRRPALQTDIAAGRLVVAEYQSLAAAQLAFWDAQFTAALHAGARSLHVVGDVSGGALGRRSTIEEVLEYEAEFDRTVSRRFPVTTLCQYDARTLSGVEAARLLRLHGDVFRHPVDHLVS